MSISTFFLHNFLVLCISSLTEVFVMSYQRRWFLNKFNSISRRKPENSPFQTKKQWLHTTFYALSTNPLGIFGWKFRPFKTAHSLVHGLNLSVNIFSVFLELLATNSKNSLALRSFLNENRKWITTIWLINLLLKKRKRTKTFSKS